MTDGLIREVGASVFFMIPKDGLLVIFISEFIETSKH